MYIHFVNCIYINGFMHFTWCFLIIIFFVSEWKERRKQQYISMLLQAEVDVVLFSDMLLACADYKMLWNCIMLKLYAYYGLRFEMSFKLVSSELAFVAHLGPKWILNVSPNQHFFGIYKNQNVPGKAPFSSSIIFTFVPYFSFLHMFGVEIYELVWLNL